MTKKQELASKRADKLIEDLRESNLSRKQNFTALVIRKGKKVVSYCALGALACEKKMIGFIDNPNYDVKIDQEWKKDKFREPPYGVILNSYGLEDKFTKTVVVSVHRKKRKDALEIDTHNCLSDLIPYLNDIGHWTFSEIADYLEELREQDYFQTCSQKKMKNTNKYLIENIEYDDC